MSVDGKGADGTGAASILVCESSNRWQRALRFYSGDKSRRTLSKQTRLKTRSVAIRSVTIGEARALMVSVRPLIVFWELSGTNAVELVRAASIGARSQQPPLQIACLPAVSHLSLESVSELAIAMRRLGVSALLENPEQLELALRMLDRFLRAFALKNDQAAFSADLDKP